MYKCINGYTYFSSYLSKKLKSLTSKVSGSDLRSLLVEINVNVTL